MFHTDQTRDIGFINHAGSFSRLVIVITALFSSAADASAPFAAMQLTAEDHYAAWASDELVFTVEVAANGYLLVDVSPTEIAENELFIDLVGPTETVEVLERTSSAWLVAVHKPETLSFRLDSMDSRREPGAFHLRTRFLEEPLFWNRKESRTSADVLHRLCEDDPSAGENLLCAKQLDDEKMITVAFDATVVRTFSLLRWETVEIDTLGEYDTVGVLFDDTGLRVAADDDSGEKDNLRIVQTLPPGRYHLRLARRGESGEALLRLRRGSRLRPDASQARNVKHEDDTEDEINPQSTKIPQGGTVP